MTILSQPIKHPFEVRPQGLYCKAGDFYIDAWQPVPLCVVTHAHGDHARYGHGRYIASEDSLEILQHRLGAKIAICSLPYGQKMKLGDCWISLHPAGHILGSAQIRIETVKGVFVVSGDYKRASDTTCKPFEVVPCDLFVTESTFGLPIYQWEDSEIIGKKIFDWWQENRAEGHPSVLFCYALGKAQRILSLLKKWTDENVCLHGALVPLTKIYADKGISMVPFSAVGEQKKSSFSQDLILAPPSAAGSLWLKRFPNFRTGFASGWMLVRGTRRRKGMDRGFVLSDHADWNSLVQTIIDTGASKILTTHGNTDVLAKYLREEKSIDAWELKGLESIDEDEE